MISINLHVIYMMVDNVFSGIFMRNLLDFMGFDGIIMWSTINIIFLCFVVIKVSSSNFREKYLLLFVQKEKSF